MELWIFYQNSDFYESFLQFNSKIKRKQSVQKAEQLMVAKYFSLIKYAGSTLDNSNRLYDVNTCSYCYYISK